MAYEKIKLDEYLAMDYKGRRKAALEEAAGRLFAAGGEPLDALALKEIELILQLGHEHHPDYPLRGAQQQPGLTPPPHVPFMPPMPQMGMPQMPMPQQPAAQVGQPIGGMQPPSQADPTQQFKEQFLAMNPEQQRQVMMSMMGGTG